MKDEIQVKEKPSWWPENPYPEDIFPTPRARYPKLIPDPHLRTAISGMLGRLFWDIASDAIWDRLLVIIEETGVIEDLIIKVRSGDKI
jgi:hypothetical protein